MTTHTPQQIENETSCLEIVDDSLGRTPGIRQIRLDTEKQTVALEYDTRQISPDAAAQAVQSISPVLQKKWETCVMRLGRQGGRACESCALLLENHLQRLPGVERASASYAGGVLSVRYDQTHLSPEVIAQQVEQLGVSVEPSASEGVAPLPAFDLRRVEAVFTAVTLFAMLFGWLGESQGWSAALVTAVYVVAYVAGGTFGLKGGLESLRHRTVDIDLLMILAALGAALVGQPFEGAMLLFLFSLSNVLQDYALDRTRNAIRALMKLRPNQASVKRGNQLVTLPIEKIIVGDHMVVKPGERIALDGVILAGEGAVDQSSLTGESLPIDKREGDKVFAGTMNQNGSLEIAITRLAKDSTITRLIKLVEEAQSEKAETQRFIDRAEQYYAIGVLLLTALVALLPPLFWQESFGAAFYRAMTVMVAASPCALVISTPATVLSAIGNGARKGVLFKGGIHVENAATIKVMAFDKTGTLTVGKPQVTDVELLETQNLLHHKTELLQLAASAESRSEHPLAQAVVQAALAQGLKLSEVQTFQATTGKGIRAVIQGREFRIGNMKYFEKFPCVGLETAVPLVNHLQSEGKTSVLVAEFVNQEQMVILGVIAFADVIRPDAADVVRQLKAQGVEQVVMLTGDHQVVATFIGKEAGVDEVYADLLPEDKLQTIKRLRQQYGPVAMVGDGVNDAPALAAATIGIAMGAAGTDVALETADIVLMSDDLQKIPYLIGLSHQTRKTLMINLGFALLMILLMLITIFAADLPLPLAVIGHEGGTVLVSLNGLRLLTYRWGR